MGNGLIQPSQLWKHGKKSPIWFSMCIASFSIIYSISIGNEHVRSAVVCFHFIFIGQSMLASEWKMEHMNLHMYCLS